MLSQNTLLKVGPSSGLVASRWAFVSVNCSTHNTDQDAYLRAVLEDSRSPGEVLFRIPAALESIGVSEVGSWLRSVGCLMLLVYCDRGISPRMLLEIEAARRAQIPVQYRWLRPEEMLLRF